MIIINDDDDYSNPYEESDDNITKIKEWITKIRKVLPACVYGTKNNNNRSYKIISNKLKDNNSIIINNSNL